MKGTSIRLKPRYNRIRTLLKVALCGASASAMAAPALAQDVAANSADVPASTEASGGDLIVTARRRNERVEDVPVSITALSPAEIKRYNLTSMQKIAAVTPQMSIATTGFGSGAEITLRGISSPFSSAGIEQSVAIIIDGAYYPQGRVVTEGFFDMAGVEILKGPQALFFGKNATAGVISITTADPGDKLEAQVRASYEFRLHTVDLEGIISAPLTDTLGVRLAVKANKSFNGWTHNLATPATASFLDVATGAVNTYTFPAARRDQPREKDVYGRLTVKWAPTDTLTSTLKGYINHLRAGNLTANVVVQCPTSTFALNPSIACPRRQFITYQNDLTPLAQDWPYAKDGNLYDNYDSRAANLNTTWSGIDNVDVTSVLNYNHSKFNAIQEYSYENAPPGFATYHFVSEAYSAEVRGLTKFDGPFNVLVGGYIQHTDLHVQDFTLSFPLENSAAPVGRRYHIFDVDSKTKGNTKVVYAQAILKPTDTIEVAGGARYTHETKDSYFVQPYVNPAFAAVFLQNTVVRGDQTFNNWSPEATISWKVRPGLMIYGAYKTGYKSGGFSNSSILTATTPDGGLEFKPEKVRGFEGGIKSTMLDRQLRLNLGIYRYVYRDLQLEFYNATNVSFVDTNAGSAVTKGVEVEAGFNPHNVPGLDVHGTVNYNKARYKDFEGPCYIGQTIAQGCTLIGPGGAQFQDLAGTPTANAPNWTASAGLAYDRVIGSAHRIGFSVDARHSGRYFASAYGSPLSRQPSYTSLNSSLRFGAESGLWEVAVIGQNLTNRFIVNAAYDITGTGSGTGTTMGRQADQASYIALPRTVELQVTLKL